MRSTPNEFDCFIPTPEGGREGGGGGLKKGNPWLTFVDPARGGGESAGATGESGAGHLCPLVVDASSSSAFVGV